MTWDNLNKLQQAYLKVIYEVDQETERQERSMWSGGRPRSAVEWRWMYYGIIPETGTDSPLRRRLMLRKLIDQSTSSTFESLAEYGYILLQYKPVATGKPFTYVQITPAGRRLVRTALGVQRKMSPRGSTLRRWHWRALTLAWQSRPDGIKNENGYYGRISWNTWLRLRDYKARKKEKPLVEEYSTTDANQTIHWLKLTPYGELYYRENWQRYHELYPSVEAPAPKTTARSTKVRSVEPS